MLSFGSKRSTQTDMFGRKHWRPPSSASSDTFVTPMHGQSLNTWELCQQLSIYWREWFGLSTHGAVFPAYPPANQNPSNEGASSWTSTLGQRTPQQASPTSQQIPTPILQLAWPLFRLIDQNLHQNAELIPLLNTSTSGNVNDLNGENLDS